MTTQSISSLTATEQFLRRNQRVGKVSTTELSEINPQGSLKSVSGNFEDGLPNEVIEE